MEDIEPRAWLEIEPGERFVRYGDLAHRLAKALHPVSEEDEPYDYHYGFARVQFDEELQAAVQSGEIVPRNALTGGKHSFPFGAALDDAVVPIRDLEAFAREREIGVRVRQDGNSTGLPAAPTVRSPPGRAQQAKPLQAQAAQEAAVLRVVRALGYEPKQLPPIKPGKPWVKSEVWCEIGVSQLFISEIVFGKAWERLRASGEIAERNGL